eukprot:scaffold90350_cov48-Prasinocladus_malaysianus.AAC.4
MARLSYVEIYNEVINDLLDKDRKNLQVVEDAIRGQVWPVQHWYEASFIDGQIWSGPRLLGPNI